MVDLNDSYPISSQVYPSGTVSVCPGQALRSKTMPLHCLIPSDRIEFTHRFMITSACVSFHRQLPKLGSPLPIHQ